MGLSIEKKIDRMDRKLSRLLDDMNEVRVKLEEQEEDFTTHKAADMLNVSYHTFMVNYSNKIPFERRGKRRFYKPSDVLAFKKSIQTASIPTVTQPE